MINLRVYGQRVSANGPSAVQESPTPLEGRAIHLCASAFIRGSRSSLIFEDPVHQVSQLVKLLDLPEIGGGP